MLNRRLLLLSGFAAVALGVDRPDAATGLRKVGVLGSRRFDRDEPETAALIAELARLGYSEGRNLEFIDRHCGEALDRLDALAAELVNLKVDVILPTHREAIPAARRVTSSIPIVMIGSANPVREGWIQSFAHPGGNVTGNASSATEVEVKALELLIETLGKPKRLAYVVFTPFRQRPTVLEQIARLEATAGSAGVQLRTVDVPDGHALGKTFQSLADARTEGVMLHSFATKGLGADEVGALMRYRLPTIVQQREFVQAGALMSFTPNILEMYRRAAAYVAKVLNGAQPADLPVELANRFELVINLKTASALGLKIPASVILRADELIR
ncbi:MAG: ABC transporter substrate-binding protein [Caldimonas sp.]